MSAAGLVRSDVYSLAVGVVGSCAESLANHLRFRTLLVSKDGLDHAKNLVTSYKLGKMREMTPDLWQAKKVVDSTLHPGALM